MLRYVYEGKVLNLAFVKNGKYLTVAVDRYGAPSLRLAAEVILVNALVLRSVVDLC